MTEAARGHGPNLTGAVIEVPAFTAGVWLLARMGIGDRSASWMHVLRLTTVFAGVAALFTAAGIGRLAAYASVDKIGGRRHAMFIAARAHAAAGAGLIFIAIIPHGNLPERGLLWVVIPGLRELSGLTLVFAVPWVWLAGAWMLSAVLGLLAGLLPAWRAARLEPAPLLRGE